MSVIIPARNEAGWLRATFEAALRSAREFQRRTISPAATDRAVNPPAAARIADAADGVEIIIVDNESTDGTAQLASGWTAEQGVMLLRCAALGAARARNFGRRFARGRVLIFVDADTHLPPHAICRIVSWCDDRGKEAGITRLASLEGGVWAWIWWTFWEHVRRLPLPKAKAMPAVMFCTAAAFDEFGPFDEEVAIGEEWPILAGLYRARPGRFVYDRSLTALSSNRRMERQRFGYCRTLFKYLWAIVDRRGRIRYTDTIR